MVWAAPSPADRVGIPGSAQSTADRVGIPGSAQSTAEALEECSQGTAQSDLHTQ